MLPTLIGLYSLTTTSIALATDWVPLGMETEALKLDTDTVLDIDADEALIEPEEQGNIKIAYNSDHTPHAVVFPVAEGTALAFLEGQPFSTVVAADVSSLSFSEQPVDLPLEIDDTVVVLTSEGLVFKLGNAIENSDLSVTLDYEQLQ